MAMKTRLAGGRFAMMTSMAWLMATAVATAQDKPLASIKGADPDVRIDITFAETN